MARRTTTWVVLLALASVVCWQAAQSAPVEEDDAELYRLFVDALENVDRSYVKEIDRRQLVEAAINGMLDSLDPYSNFIGPQDFQQFNRSTVGKFGGIGVQISLRDGSLKVVSPLVGTPAYEAGILAGDLIEKINGQPTKGLALDQVVDLLTGPAGTEVTLTIRHAPYTGAEKEVTLKRAVINIESVMGDTHGEDNQWDFMVDKENKIGYVRITSFIPSTKADLQAAIDGLIKQGMKGLIIDLRYNPGGLLSSAIEVSDLFIKEGLIVKTKGRNTIDKPFYAKEEGTYSDFPIAVLVNGFSASASEIVSACLQDHKRAVIVGERTWGKGSVQNVIELEGGNSALKLTTAGYHRPSGHNIHRFKDSTEEDEWGVKPNEGFEVKFTPADHKQYRDWRDVRDRIIGKASAIREAEQEANGEEKEKKKEAKPEQDAPEPDGDDAKDQSGEEEAANNDKADVDPEKTYHDKQLSRALEYLREQISGKAEQEKKADKAAEEKEKSPEPAKPE